MYGKSTNTVTALTNKTKKTKIAGSRNLVLNFSMRGNFNM